MEQGSGASIGKWLFIGLGFFLFMQFGWPLISGKSNAPDRQPFVVVDYTLPPGDRPEEKLCTLRGERSEFVLSTRGASLRKATMLDRRYSVDVAKPDVPIELVSTSREERMPLRVDLVAPLSDDAKGAQLIAEHNLDWTLSASDTKTCTFTYASETASVTKRISLTDRAFELSVDVTVKNLADAPKRHRLAVEQTSWRTLASTQSSFWDLGRRPEWLTDLSLHSSDGVERVLPDSFEPADFEDERFTAEKWLRAKSEGLWAAVTTNYFASAILHVDGFAKPAAEALVEDGTFYGQKRGDASFGNLYRARLAYPEKELAKGEETTYRLAAFLGPKERDVLAHVGGGDRDRLASSQLIDLGMFGSIGRFLVGYVIWLAGAVGSWGWAIALLTVTVKFAVFPLQLPSMRTSIEMRRVKPEVDAINARYGDDMVQKNLALQELYRREGIRPMVGCLPLLLQMPVWFSLYAALQSAVELYHTPFGPLIPDLSQSDPYHVIPIILGASSFLQQKVMPAQGMDPAQQKLMLYLMPGMFTAMMFFMPAGLGVYMITNTWLGILQQVGVERFVGSRIKQPANIEVREVSKGSEGDPPATGKGKVRARG